MSELDEVKALIRGVGTSVLALGPRLTRIEAAIEDLRGDQAKTNSNVLVLRSELEVTAQDVKDLVEQFGNLNQIVAGVRSLGKSTFDMVTSQRQAQAGDVLDDPRQEQERRQQ